MPSKQEAKHAAKYPGGEVDGVPKFNAANVRHVEHTLQHIAWCAGNQREKLLDLGPQIVALCKSYADLLEALEAVTDALLLYDGHIGNPGNPEGWTEAEGGRAWTQARAAIAKARGVEK